MQDLWKRLQYPCFPWTGANSFCSLRSREHASIFSEILNAYSICACSSVYAYEYNTRLDTVSFTCMYLRNMIHYIYIYPNQKSTNLQYFDEKIVFWAYFIKRSSFCQKFVFSWKLLKTPCFHGFGRDPKRILKGMPGQFWYSSWCIPIFNAILYPFCVLILK